ncbi:MAG: HAD-IA family hydrolase [Gammaproteobacteria bacterium]|nr:HAD-IA family hydrolase [Gammaproteobacteria bacterium]
MPKIKTVLFDLDGTLADTAPDLAAALNHVLKTNNYDPLPFETIRPVVSHGGIALVTLGFGEKHPQFDRLYKELLEYYQNNIANETTLFPGMDELLLELESKNINWGIVTNKPAWLTDPLLDALNLTSRAATIVSGDTLDQRKPHPAPLLHACNQAGSEAEECLYIGDAERDIEAGNRAGMTSVVALFGYIAESDTPVNWGAHSMIESPQAIIPIIQSLS